MARRRRAVERASRRQTLLDRLLAVLLAIVAASGLMSILPGPSQVAVSRFACRVGSLGLGSCGTARVDLENVPLSPPRCSTLASLDQTLPEVSVSQLTTADGLAVTLSRARSGDVFAQFGSLDSSEPPFLLAGEGRALREVVPGVSLSTAAEWFLPSGQGLNELVQAVHDRHQQWVQRRSSLAVLSALTSRADRQVPAPTVLLSRARLDEPLLPRFPAEGSPPTSTVPRTGVGHPKGPRDAVSVTPGRPAVSVLNRVRNSSALVAPIDGVVRGTPVRGTMRWTRDSSGTVTSVVVALVSSAGLAGGEPREPGMAVDVAYLSVPVTTLPERTLVQAWLSDPGGFRLGLDELLGLAPPNPGNQLASFLTRAATVTLLRFSGINLDQAQDRVATELTLLRRVEWPGAQMVGGSVISPQPDGSPRTVAADPACRTA